MLPHSRSCCQGSLLTSRMCKVCGYRFAGPSRCLLFAAIPLLLPIFLHRLAHMQPMQVTVNLRCLLRLPFCVLFELSCALQQQACFCILSFEGLAFALGFALSLLALVLTLLRWHLFSLALEMRLLCAVSLRFGCCVANFPRAESQQGSCAARSHALRVSFHVHACTHHVFVHVL